MRVKNNQMRSKNLFLTIILVINILLIGAVKYFVSEDSVQTKKSRIDFFSENLSFQKNNIILSYKKSSSLIRDEIMNDSVLMNYINHLASANSEEIVKIAPKFKKRIDLYYKNLNDNNISSINFIFKNQNALRIFDTETGRYIIKTSEQWDQVLSKQLAESMIDGTTIDDGKFAYLFIFPISTSYEKTITSYINIEFDIQKINTNDYFPFSKSGFLIYSTDKSLFDSVKGIRQMNEENQSDFVFTDIFPSQEVFPILGKKELNRLHTQLKNAYENQTTDQFSTYYQKHGHYHVLSLSEFKSLNSHSRIFFISTFPDRLIDKTQQLNNQLILVWTIILLFVMAAIIYLYLNRMKILREKNNIQLSELKLKELNQSKDKFFSILAHDLKNPFNGIMGMTGYLYESYDEIDDAERLDIINEINIASKNAFNLLQNLLEWTRTQSGQIKNIPVKIEPKYIIEFSLETVSNLAKNKEIEIILNIQTEQNGYADENLVSTVLRNLFTNAVKFSPRQSKIEASVKQYENELVFCVKDSGIGMKSDEIDQLFRIDVNFHKRGTEDETGTGLGLKICKEFIEYCKGRIWVISEPNVGSSFFFTIPIYQ